MSEIKDGFTEIESEEQLKGLTIEQKYLLTKPSGTVHEAELHKGGYWYFEFENTTYRHYEIAGYFTAFRHVPDAAPVVGKEATYEELESPDCSKYSDYSEYCRDVAEWSKQCEALVNSPELIQREFRNLVETVRNLDDQNAQLEAEIAALKQPREWVAIKSAEQLDALPDGTYELIAKMEYISWRVARKYVNGKWGVTSFAGEYSAIEVVARFSHYRLITRAEDFTPPERKITIGGVEYSYDELAAMLKEQGLELSGGAA